MDINIDSFLKKIAQVESGGGKNFKHQKITAGPQKGQTAIGTFGLLPNTVDEIIDRSRSEGSITPEMDKVYDMEPEDQKKYLEKNPAIEYDIAKRLAKNVLAKQGGDEKKAAYAWNHGHNLSSQNIEKQDYEDSDYVKQFNKASSKISPMADMESPSVRSPSSQKLFNQFNVEGTPEEEKIKNSFQYDPKEKFKKYLAEQDAEFNAAGNAAIKSGGLFPTATDEERQLAMEKLGPMGMAALGGGLPITGMGQVGEEGVQAVGSSAIGKRVFDRLKSLLQRPNLPGPETAGRQGEFIRKSMLDPEIEQLIYPSRSYVPGPGSPGLSDIEKSLVKDATPNDVQNMINESSSVGEKTEPLDILNKLRQK